jgi:hypothetical protein
MRSGVISRGDIFNPAKFIDLIFHVSGADLHVQPRFIKRLLGNRPANAMLPGR